MNTEIEPIKKVIIVLFGCTIRQPLTFALTFSIQAGLVPTPSHIQVFDDLLKEHGLNKHNSLHETLKKFSDMATVQGE